MNLIGRRYHTFSRFYRHSFLLNLDAYDTNDIERIFSELCEWHFSLGFADKVAMLTKVRLNTMFYLFEFDFCLEIVWNIKRALIREKKRPQEEKATKRLLEKEIPIDMQKNPHFRA